MPDDAQIHETLYFAYGSNLWIDQMNRRCPDNKYLGLGLLRDWRWMIDDRGWANIVPSSGDYIYGSVYEINSKDEQSLDGYENAPHFYEKKIHAVEFIPCSGDGETEKRTINALVYIYNSTTPGIPTTEYVPRMNMAIKDGLQKGIPQSYVDKYMRPLVPTE